MSFYKRYELRRLLADGEVKTFSAVENETGRNVLLHMFNPPGQGLLAEFKTKFLRPDGSASPPAIEIGEFAGSKYAVTESIDSFQSLRQWLKQQPESLGPAAGFALDPPPQPRTAPPAPKPLPAEEPLGEFTSLFGPDPKQAKPKPAPRPAPPLPLVSDDPGDFTRAFGPSGPKPAPARPPAAAPADPGEFTRLFGGPDPAPPAPVRPAPPPPPPVAQPAWPPPPLPPTPPPAPPRASASLPAMPERNAEITSEFTKLFGSGPVGQSIDIAEEQAKAARTAPQDSRPFQQAGEFTRMFGPGEIGGSKSAGPADVTFSLNTSASSLFGSPDELARQYDASVANNSAPPDTTSEYTKIFGGPSSAEAPPPAPRPAPTAVEIPRRGLSPVIIVLITLGSAGLIAGLIYLAVYLGNR